MINTKDKVADARRERPAVRRARAPRQGAARQRRRTRTPPPARSTTSSLATKVSDAATQLVSDKDIQDADPERRRRDSGTPPAASRTGSRRTGGGRSAAQNRLLLVAGIALGLLLNPITGPSLRRVLKRKLFGSGNGFVYQGNGSKSS